MDDLLSQGFIQSEQDAKIQRLSEERESLGERERERTGKEKEKEKEREKGEGNKEKHYRSRCINPKIIRKERIKKENAVKKKEESE